MRAADVRAALARKFCAPEYALFYEVANATGSAATRSADAIAMGLWPSRGLYLQGFEIKVSRSDWLSELKNPAKAAREFEAAWELDADDTDSAVGLAQAQIELGRKADAAKTVDRILEKEPDHAEAKALREKLAEK